VKILYFDCFAGAAGDMILGALLDAGLPFDELQHALGSLALEGWKVTRERVLRGGIQATKFRVIDTSAGGSHPHDQSHAHGHTHAHDHAHTHTQGDHERRHHHHREHEHVEGTASAVPGQAHSHAHRTVKEIKAAIDRSNLSADGKSKAKALFDRLAEAEASIHGMSVDEVHLHEVGEIDSIIDVVGAVFALEWFNADRIVVSPMNVGGGMIKSAHGVFPVPAPATVRLLGDAPIYSSGIKTELLTPTGALILTGYAEGYGPVPAMRVTQVGYGAGDRDLAGTPNVLRVLMGEPVDLDIGRGGSLDPPEAPDRAEAMRVSVIECEIDDMNPQLFGPLMERLQEAGALDVFYTPIQMKKNRPATLVTVITTPARRQDAVDLLFRETTTIGLRHHETARECLARSIVSVATPLGDLRIKIARQGERIVNAQPEFDDVARVAREHDLPIKDVHALALKAWLDQRS
jgi:uncharacterized protein (TIGR00299 family) protein